MDHFLFSPGLVPFLVVCGNWYCVSIIFVWFGSLCTHIAMCLLYTSIALSNSSYKISCGIHVNGSDCILWLVESAAMLIDWGTILDWWYMCNVCYCFIFCKLLIFPIWQDSWSMLIWVHIAAWMTFSSWFDDTVYTDRLSLTHCHEFHSDLNRYWGQPNTEVYGRWWICAAWMLAFCGSLKSFNIYIVI